MNGKELKLLLLSLMFVANCFASEGEPPATNEYGEQINNAETDENTGALIRYTQSGEFVNRYGNTIGYKTTEDDFNSDDHTFTVKPENYSYTIQKYTASTVSALPASDDFFTYTKSGGKLTRVTATSGGNSDEEGVDLTIDGDNTLTIGRSSEDTVGIFSRTSAASSWTRNTDIGFETITSQSSDYSLPYKIHLKNVVLGEYVQDMFAGKENSHASDGKYNPNYSRVTSIWLDNVDVSTVRNLRDMFFLCRELKTLKFSFKNGNSITPTNMENTFNRCSSLVSITGLDKFNTSGVKNMHNLFFQCRSLTELDISSFDTSLVQNFNGMFQDCSSLTNLTLPEENFTGSSATDLQYMFSGCSSLTELDLSNFEVNNPNTIVCKYMFSNCTNLVTLKIPASFNVQKYINSGDATMFEKCTSLVVKDGYGFWGDTDSTRKTALAPMGVSSFNLYTIDTGGDDIKNTDLKNYMLATYDSIRNKAKTKDYQLLFTLSDPDSENITHNYFKDFDDAMRAVEISNDDVAYIGRVSDMDINETENGSEKGDIFSEDGGIGGISKSQEEIVLVPPHQYYATLRLRLSNKEVEGLFALGLRLLQDVILSGDNSGFTQNKMRIGSLEESGDYSNVAFYRGKALPPSNVDIYPTSTAELEDLGADEQFELEKTVDVLATGKNVGKLTVSKSLVINGTLNLGKLIATRMWILTNHSGFLGLSIYKDYDGNWKVLNYDSGYTPEISSSSIKVENASFQHGRKTVTVQLSNLSENESASSTGSGNYGCADDRSGDNTKYLIQRYNSPDGINLYYSDGIFSYTKNSIGTFDRICKGLLLPADIANTIMTKVDEHGDPDPDDGSYPIQKTKQFKQKTGDDTILPYEDDDEKKTWYILDLGDNHKFTSESTIISKGNLTYTHVIIEKYADGKILERRYYTEEYNGGKKILKTDRAATPSTIAPGFVEGDDEVGLWIAKKYNNEGKPANYDTAAADAIADGARWKTIAEYMGETAGVYNWDLSPALANETGSEAVDTNVMGSLWGDAYGPFNGSPDDFVLPNT